ncbi:HNH endonuclease [Kitasatospora sp. McL0602]|uniref:HNH endonuclease n=1 Tax=Kitasatospora sp. McL0602 TaxID=3439530 RepID=UPI003F8C8349
MSLVEGMDWRDENLGLRVRVALWLSGEVGEGGTFAREDLRSALGGTEQVDRRMRDLRSAGWVIRGARDRLGLAADEFVLEAVGAPVWEPEHRAAGLRQISAATRRTVLERDGFMCRRCGVAAGEAYPGEPGSRARLTLGAAGVPGDTTSVESGLLTECARCNDAGGVPSSGQPGRDELWGQIQTLSLRDRKELLAWMVHDERTSNDRERAWGRYRQLPADARERVKRDLYDLLRQ